MGQSKKKPKRRRDETDQEIVNWSELCPDVLRCALERLSFTDLNRAKSVCSAWHSASRGCPPKRNQIPWLILFPRNEEDNNRCVLFVPDDRDKVYKTRDLGLDFVQSRCLNTCGSWFLMSHPLKGLYILNPLTGERIELVPDTERANLEPMRACFWIDNTTKDYLVVSISFKSTVFTKKGDNKWHEFPLVKNYNEIVLGHKDQLLYINHPADPIKVWDFTRDNASEDVYPEYFSFNHYHFPSYLNENDDELYWEMLLDKRTRMAVTLSGEVLMVSCIVFRCKTWHFRIYKTNRVTREWVRFDSLGDEALIYDMGITVLAKDIPGIKRNSIYFSGKDDPDCIFVYDLTTHKMEPLPQCVSSDARWFFPC